MECGADCREKKMAAKQKGRRYASSDEEGDGTISEDDLPANAQDDPFFQHDDSAFDDPFFQVCGLVHKDSRASWCLNGECLCAAF